MKLRASHSRAQGDTEVKIHSSRAGCVLLGCRVIETAFLLHLSNAKALGWRHPLRTFVWADEADGLTGWAVWRWLCRCGWEVAGLEFF